MQKHGADTSKVSLEFYSERHREVHALKDIMKGEEIMFIPETQFLTYKKIKQTPFGDKIMKHLKTIRGPEKKQLRL